MAKDVIVPSVAESITEVMIAEWLKADGDFVNMDDNLVVIETDKASMEIAAPVSGIFKRITEEGTVVAIGTVIAQIEEGAAPAASATTTTAEAVSAPVAASAQASTSSYAAGHPSPAAAVILEGKGLSASEVQGSGVGGRITKEDAQNASAKPAVAPSIPAKAATPAAPKVAGQGQSRQKMTMLRRKLAERLVGVKNTTAMLTTFNEVDMSAVMAIRSKYKDDFKKRHEVNLGFMSFFTKACALALMDFPMVNAMIDGDEIVMNHHAHIGIAVSTEKGLVVPVLREVEEMSFAGIEKGIMDYALKARAGKISIDDMQGGTFTITNGGIFGSMLSTPIINPPQSAILGMHNIVERPVVVNGQIVIRPIMYVALSYDHRIIDGKDSVSFLKRVKDILEDPYRYFLGL